MNLFLCGLLVGFAGGWLYRRHKFPFPYRGLRTYERGSNPNGDLMRCNHPTITNEKWIVALDMEPGAL